MNKIFGTLVLIGLLAMPNLALASGFGVFTQGASGLGQANAVVAHPTGPSSLYFNPALMNDVPGRQVEVGTTAVYADRSVDFDSGGSEDAKENWNFPSTFYYTHEVNPQVTAGLGVFFPFGLSTEWDDDYAGRYIGTSAELFSTNINPAVSFRVNDKLSLAVGLDVLPKEPGQAEDPLVAAWKENAPWIRGRVLLNPHAAFYSPDAYVDQRTKGVQTAYFYLRDGALVNCVNQEFLGKRR